MYRRYYEIDESVLADIQEYENQQLQKFRSEFDGLCLSVCNSQGWNYNVFIQRWIDKNFRCTWHRKKYDGYSAMLQVDITDSNGDLIEIDEDVFSFFEYITTISFNLFTRKYSVFQNQDLREIRKEIEHFVQRLVDSGIIPSFPLK